jgi:hypothetical protein
VSRTLASLSLDADNHWSYLYVRGVAGWADAPSYLGVMTARLLELLGERDLRITVFAVGRDAEVDADAACLARLAAAGHEIGNHSFRHEPWLHRYGESELEEELGRAEAAITRAVGRRPVGFRGPGYSLSEATLRVLVRRGYEYDASTLPTVVGPLARAVYFRTARLTDAQRVERSQLYGTFRDGLRPLRPYRFRVDGGSLLELPLTVLPGLRLPVHVSYLLALSRVSPGAARAYLRGALATCRLRGVEPSVLLHPLDLLSGEDVPDLAFFPGMDIPATEKLARVGGYLDVLRADHEVVPCGVHARAHAGRDLPVVEPRFAA